MRIVEEMLNRGIVLSRRKLSTDWLGRAPNYLSLSRDEISPAAGLVLVGRLIKAGQHGFAGEVLTHLLNEVQAGVISVRVER